MPEPEVIQTEPQAEPVSTSPPVAADPPSNPYGVDPAEYAQIQAESEAMFKDREGGQPAEEAGADASRTRDEHGRFVSGAKPEAAPAAASPQLALNPMLVTAARDIGLDVTGVADNRELSGRIQSARFEAAQKMGRILGVDPSEMAEFFSHRAQRGQPGGTPAPEPQPAAEPEPEPVFAITSEEEESLDPALTGVIKRLAQHVAVTGGKAPKTVEEKLSAVERQLGSIMAYAAQQQEAEQSRVWDDAAEAAGLNQLFGIKASSALAAVRAGNTGHQGVGDWQSFTAMFFLPRYNTLLQSGLPDSPETVHRAMAEAKASAQQRWSQLAGVTAQAPRQGGLPQVAALPSGVVRSASRMQPEVNPYKGMTYEDTLYEETLQEERNRWAQNGGRNPYAPTY